jgi:isopentenyl diphosphate isomerase/L-lactate dehydrogenase-like FMN-dependent dehydrogenase
LRGVVEPSLKTTFLGREYDSPVLLAPIGSVGSFYSEGALGPARVAVKNGLINFVGTLASPGLAAVAAGAGGPLMFQLYVWGDRDWLRDLIRRVEGAGYQAICLTTDSLGPPLRERLLHNRVPLRDGADRPNVPDNGELGHHFKVSFCWDDFDWLRSITRLPIVLKGITTAEDAVMGVEHGADAIYVSNHGGRELDHLPSTIEVLPEIVAALNGRADVLVDSGFLRGSDIVKGLALGAKAVGIGKLQLWGLSVEGEAGLEQTLEILNEEIRGTLQLLGVGSIAELDASYLRPTIPTRPGPIEWNQYEFPTLPRL